MLRKSLYCAEAPSALRLAAVNGRVLSQRELDAWHRIQPRDFVVSDWASAAQAAWDELTELFPDGPRRSVEIHDVRHRSLDEAFAVAHSHLAAWNPRIEFCGVPDEAQYGFALMGAHGRVRAARVANARDVDAALGSRQDVRPRTLVGGAARRVRRRMGQRRRGDGPGTVAAAAIHCDDFERHARASARAAPT